MDWTAILSEIFAAGKTQMVVAAYCGCGQSAISQLYSGVTTQPRYEVGNKLMELHASVVPQKKPSRRGKPS